MRHFDDKGYSLTELLIVVGLLGVVFAIAVVSMSGLSGSIKYKNTAWSISSQLRLAKQMAVTDNREERVEFAIGAGQFRLTEGNLPAGSAVWTQVKPWTPVDQGVTLSTGAACNGTADINIKFNPNGTADSGTICVKDSGGAVKYSVDISSTSGRVTID